MIKHLAEPRKEKITKHFWNFSTSSGWSRVPRWAWPRAREREWSTPSNTRGDSTVSQQGGGGVFLDQSHSSCSPIPVQSLPLLRPIPEQSPPPPTPGQGNIPQVFAVSAIVSGMGMGGGVSRSVRHTWWKKSVGGDFSTTRQRSTILTASDTTHTEEVRVTRNSRSAGGGEGGEEEERRGGRRRSCCILTISDLIT